MKLCTDWEPASDLEDTIWKLHEDWVRIGAFLFDSHAAILTEEIIEPLRITKAERTEN
ncbi:hypothetical protein ACS0TY_013136 [Phlomoides rotata]